MIPYRRSTTAGLLENLDARPVHILRRPIAFLSSPNAIRTGPPSESASAHVAAEARSLNLVHLGALSEELVPREVWVDTSRTLQLHASRKIRFFATYFEDGSCVITGHGGPATLATRDLDVRGGRGTVEDDLAAHDARVIEWAARRDTVPMRVEDIDTAARMQRYYYRHVISLFHAGLAWLAIALVIALGVAVGWQLVGR